MIVEASFDVTTATWFVGKLEARTLAQLSKMLPAGSVIAGYFPNGYNVKTEWPKEATVRVGRGGWASALHLRSSPNPPPARKAPSSEQEPCAARVGAPHKKMPFMRRPGKLKYDREKILNMWAAGKTGPEIARALGIEHWTRVSGIVAEERKRGDPRAVSRSAASGWRRYG